MNRQQRGIVVGMVLGDGHIRTATAADKLAGRRIAAQITFAHCIAQRGYLEHKISKLNSFFGGNATVRVHKYSDRETCHASKSNPYFKTLKGMMYRKGRLFVTRQVLNMLTPEGIAFWFMDDGSTLRRSNKVDGHVTSVVTTLASYHSLPEIQEIIRYFAEVHGVECKSAYHRRSDLWCVRMNTGGTRAFVPIIAPYIHKDLAYKLDGCPGWHECLATDASSVDDIV